MPPKTQTQVVAVDPTDPNPVAEFPQGSEAAPTAPALSIGEAAGGPGSLDPGAWLLGRLQRLLLLFSLM